MTTVWVVLGVAGAVVASTVGWVAWRDRERTASAEDRAAGRAALVQQQRYERDRHASQSDVIRRGDDRS
ncbi:hypothetical protein AB0I37_11345 [Micromonospora purpureochromogenes]|uniref:hypothetical protein n=1 Tax=Micromonospora purpureochromogenes TaxID=47872 RepID=UPI0034005D5B